MLKKQKCAKFVTKQNGTGTYQVEKFDIPVVQLDKTWKKYVFCVDFVLFQWYPNQALNEGVMKKPNDWKKEMTGRKKSS